MATWKLEVGQKVARLKGKGPLTIIKQITNDEGKPYYKLSNNTIIEESKITLTTRMT